MSVKRSPVFSCILLLLIIVSCQREQRDLRSAPPSRSTVFQAARQSEIQPGGPLPTPGVGNPFQDNAQAISEGKRLFDWYNCSGCHAHGGGAIGPALMDNDWTYGGEPANIYDSIVKGRPNGMPTWGGRIPEYQIWQLVAYVRSLSSQQSKSASPARTDQIYRDAEQYRVAEDKLPGVHPR